MTSSSNLKLPQIHVSHQLVHIYKSNIFWWALCCMNQQISWKMTHWLIDIFCKEMFPRWKATKFWSSEITEYRISFMCSYLNPSYFSRHLCSSSARPWTWRDSRNPFTTTLWKHERFFTWSSRFIHSCFGKIRRSCSLDLHPRENSPQRSLKYIMHVSVSLTTCSLKSQGLIFIKTNRFTLSLNEDTLLLSSQKCKQDHCTDIL